MWEEGEFSYIAGRKVKIVQPFWKIIWWFLLKINHTLIYDLVISTCLYKINKNVHSSFIYDSQN